MFDLELNPPMSAAMKSIKCKAVTASGKQCTRNAGKSGFCKAHEQKNKLDYQRKKYCEAVDTILKVCRTNRWGCSVSLEDPNGQFAEVAIRKEVDYNVITGVIYVTVDEGVQCRIEKTSFYNYGQEVFLDAISLKLGELDWLESKAKRKKRGEGPKPSQLIVRILKNFDRAARQLKRRYNNRAPYEINDEYDVQDLLHSILRAYFEDIRPEEYTPSYAGSSSKVDFLLKPERAVIEVKYATDKLREKKIGEQLIIDINKYKAHPDCDALYCLVYDREGNIRNPIGFENDLSGKHSDITVTVLVVPH